MEARAASDLADWLVHLELEGKADRTLYGYHREIARLLRAHPDLELSAFTHSHINDVLRTVPERSRHIARAIYNGFFTWAVTDERIERSPMVKVPRMRQPHRRPKGIFSDAGVALLESLPNPHGHLFSILFGTGLRRGEAIGLKREHVDLGRRRLVVLSGKGGKDRIVSLTQQALQAVADLDLLERLDGPEYVWAVTRKQPAIRTHPISTTGFERWYRTCLENAGVPYLNPHQTRHTYGHRMRELGLTLEERQLLMGHESIRTTQHYYGTLTIEDVSRRLAELEGIF